MKYCVIFAAVCAVGFVIGYGLLDVHIVLAVFAGVAGCKLVDYLKGAKHEV